MAQWATIDAIAASAQSRDLQLAVTLIANSGTLDYEEKYIDLDRMVSGFDPVPITAPSPFAFRHELFAWYVVGRLAAYTHVHYTMMHEWDVGAPSTGDDGPYSAAELRGFCNHFASVEPYLANDPLSKITNTCPGRGTFYAQFGAVTTCDQNQGYSGTEGWSGNFQYMRLHLTEDLTRTSLDDAWRSCIGLQRGGELGITSLESNLNSWGVYATTPFANVVVPGPSGSSIYLPHSVDNRPIFIEEEWISRNDPPDESGPGNLQPLVGGGFSCVGNPYAAYWRDDGGVGCPNPYKFAFITNNYQGLRKAIRDHAWMAGVVCQSYTSFWSRRYGNLIEDIDSSSQAPYAVIRKYWTAKAEWWRFSYDSTLVAEQSVVPALPGDAPYTTWPPPGLPDHLDDPIVGAFGRRPYEQSVVGARSDHTPAQYVIYSPVGGITANNSVTIDLSALGSGASFSYRYVHPDNGGTSTTYMTNMIPGSTTAVFTPSAPYQGELGEWVLLINVPT